MTIATLEGLDRALTATRQQYLAAIKADHSGRAEKILARLDELLDLRCIIHE